MKSHPLPEAPPLLAARGLVVAQGGRTLVARLDFSLGAGEWWAILGPNGAGKTTLLHTLAGLHPPAAGEVWLAGRPIRRWPGRQRAQRLGVLFQGDGGAFPATVLETVLSGRHPHLPLWGGEGPGDLRVAREAMAAMDLTPLAARPVTTLSGGERRRVEVAALLAQDPTLMLLDEPVNHLDLAHRMALMTLLAARTRGADDHPGGRGGVAVVLHDLNLAARFASHVLLLFGDGRVSAGPRAALFTEATLSQLYRHPVMRLPAPDGGECWLPR